MELQLGSRTAIPCMKTSHSCCCTGASGMLPGLAGATHPLICVPSYWKTSCSFLLCSFSHKDEVGVGLLLLLCV